MSTNFSHATSWIVRRRWLSALLVVFLSAIAVGGHVAPDSVVAWFKSLVEREAIVEEESFDPSAIQEEDDFVPPPMVETIQSSGFDVIVVVESESFFTPNGAEAIRGVVNHLESLDYVLDVLWMDKIPVLNVFGLNEPLLPRHTSDPAKFENARNKARQHPLVNGQLLSDDGKTLLLMININFLFVESDETFTSRIREESESALRQFPDVDMEFLVTGRVPAMLKVMRAHEQNQLKYQVIAYGMILLLSMILFRGAIAVGVVAMAPAFGIFWTMGFIRYFEFQLNPFNDVVLPILVALVGFTDGVHLMVQIRRERSAGLTAINAAQEGIRKVGLACFLTSLTTAVGFGSLALAHNELVREFGYCCVIGVTLSFISVLLTIPLASSTWLGQRIHRGHGKGFIDKNLNRISGIIDWVLKYPRRMSVIAIVVSLTCFFISLTLRPDERQGDILPRNSEPAIALRKMDAAMGGLEQASIEIHWDSGVDEGDGAKLLTVLEQVDTVLAQEPLIGHPISVLNLLQALPGEGRPADRASLLELLPPELKRTYYTPEYRFAYVRFRIQDLGIATYGPVFERIESQLKQISESNLGFHFELKGTPVFRWQNIYQIVVDLVASLGTAAVIIFIILAIVYRSLRIGIISILPNLFPLCVAGTYLALSGQALEIVTVCAFTCCLGIAVDDTIHFLTRYYEEKKVTPDDAEAIRKAFTAVGTALVMTTLVLVSGFLTVLFSDTREHRIFASMGAITVSAALFGDLVFLPAILKTFSGKSKRQANDGVEKDGQQSG